MVNEVNQKEGIKQTFKELLMNKQIEPIREKLDEKIKQLNSRVFKRLRLNMICLGISSDFFYTIIDAFQITGTITAS